MNGINSEMMEQHFSKELQSLGAVFEFLDRFLAAQSIDASSGYVVTLAVEEFFTNIVKYGGDRSGTVSISAARDGKRIVVVIVDPDANRFDPTQVAPPRNDLSLEEKPIGGLGIHLSRRMLDDVRYEYTGRTSRITLVKNLEQ